MKIRGFFKDISGASRVTKARKDNFAKASSVPDPRDPIRELADLLHPSQMEFEVTKITEASPTARTFRLESVDGHIPVFQCGQYLVLNLAIGKSVLNRPYTISSAPFEARSSHPFVEITVRRNVPYLVPDYLFDQIKTGDLLKGNLPFGTFYYEPLRDSSHVVALAGGSGITPFVSMAKEIARGSLDFDLTILYGSVRSDDIICKDILSQLEAECSKVHVVHVLSDDPDWSGEKGFIGKELIEKYSREDATYMFCGPRVMFGFVEKALAEMGVAPRRFRHDVIGQPSQIFKEPGYPEASAGKTYTITVVQGISRTEIPAASNESVAIALERAGIPIDTHCRSGECGFCRSQLLEGDIFVPSAGDGRRLIDKEMGWFHACSAYPVSDLKIKIPIL